MIMWAAVLLRSHAACWNVKISSISCHFSKCIVLQVFSMVSSRVRCDRLHLNVAGTYCFFLKNVRVFSPITSDLAAYISKYSMDVNSSSPTAPPVNNFTISRTTAVQWSSNMHDGWKPLSNKLPVRILNCGTGSDKS